MPNYAEELRVIEERIIALQRDLQAVVAGAASPVADSGYGCCSKEGCCEKQGCCERTKLPDFGEYELEALSDRFGLPVEVLVDRIDKLDPKLLKGKTKS